MVLPSAPIHPDALEIPATGRSNAFFYGWIGAVTVVASVALCCGLVAFERFGSDSSAGSEATRVPMRGSVILRVDGSLSYSDAAARCRLLTLRAEETAAEVRLAAYEEGDDLAGCASARYHPLPPTATVGIGRLGVRGVVAAGTGEPLPVFAEADALLLPPVLAGWLHWYEVVSVVGDFGGPGSATFAAVYPADADDRTSPAPSAEDELWIIGSRGGGWVPPPATVTTLATVRGHAGVAAPGIVVWSEGACTMAVRWDSVRHAPPATDRLVAIAAALVVGNGGPACPG
jgi:hypothetical protein